MARRRRKSSFSSSRKGGRLGLALPILAGIVLIGGFIYLVNVGDSVLAPQQETRVELPNAFKESP